MSKTDKAALAIAGLALALLLAALPYAAGYGDMRKTILNIIVSRWFDAHSTTWQYCALVPVVVGWLVWKKRAALASLTPAPSFGGLGVLVVALLSYFVGYKANNYYFGFLGIQIFVAGVIVWLLGWTCFRVLRFPWLVLGFVWPLIFLEDRIGFQLRMISTHGVMFVARMLHAPIIAEGTSLYSASSGQETGSWMTLSVDGPCSGMNTLFALLFVGTIFSWHVEKSNLRRAFLFACCIPLALAGNMVRILLLISGCALFGQDFAVGNEQNEMTIYHMFSGLVVFPILVAGLKAISRQLKKRRPAAKQTTPILAQHA